MKTTSVLNKIIACYDELALNKDIRKISIKQKTRYFYIPRTAMVVSLILLIVFYLKAKLCWQIVSSCSFLGSVIFSEIAYQRFHKKFYQFKQPDEKDFWLHTFNKKLIDSNIKLSEINSSIALLDLKYNFNRPKTSSVLSGFFFTLVFSIVSSNLENLFKEPVVFVSTILLASIVPLFHVFIDTFIIKEYKNRQIFNYLNRIKIEWSYEEEIKTY